MANLDYILNGEYDDILFSIKNILGLNDGSKDDVLYQLMHIQMSAINSYIGSEVVPSELEFIVIETVVSRYNRLGSEGLKTEEVDVISMTYTENLLDPYKNILDKHIERTTPKPTTNNKKIKMF